MGLRYFKCNVLGGFRLADLNKNVKQGEHFYLEDQIVETSRASIAALKSKWMIEVDEKEASKHISIPKDLTRKVGVMIKSPIVAKSFKSGVSTPNVQEVNKNMEVRQTENNKLNASKPSIPDFSKVEKNTKERHNESTNNRGASSDAEMMRNEEKVATPVMDKDQRKEKLMIVTDKFLGDVVESEVSKPKLNVDTPTKEEEEKVVKNLVNEDAFDNSELSIPNFDEKKEVKEEVKTNLETKIKRKRGRKKSEAKKSTEE